MHTIARWTREQLHSPAATLRHLDRRPIALLLAILLVTASFVGATPASAQTSLPSASFSGGAGTVSVGGTLHARSDVAISLDVATTSVRCITWGGGHSGSNTVGGGNNPGPQTSWRIPLTSLPQAGEHTVTVNAFGHQNCQNNPAGTATATYFVDNTGPTVTASLTPEANAAGWRNANATITWAASDVSGVASGPTPASDTVTTDTAGVTKTATAVDRLGNSGSGSVTAKLDKTAPTITGSRSPAANSHGWNNSDVTVSFTCADALSGTKSCPGTSEVTTEGADQSRSGTATDNADNSASATVGGINIDTTAPTLSGAPTPDNLGANGWYTGDVTVAWTAADDRSGLVAQPANSTVSGEGTGLTAATTVQDKAGNSRTASSAAVKIDRTGPETSIDAPEGWRNADAAITLMPSDNLSGVATSHYRIDGGALQTGRTFTLSEGVHEVAYYSVDQAGNVEDAKTATVRIDTTAPSISHVVDPAANAHNWHNTAAKVTFTCADSESGSGIASCAGDAVVTEEAAGQTVTGTATDNAGNAAEDTATVNLDLTAPTITAARDRGANEAGWYKDDVTVSFTCEDALSGVGVAEGTDCPGAVTLGEGADQSASGSVTDAAGNTASVTESGVNVDTTPPSLTGTPSTTDWTNADVTVSWAASDALSGLAGPVPAPSTVEGEGDNLSASASVADTAGNLASATEDGIKIDRTAPVTTASYDEPLPSGWYADGVEVALTGADALSGVAATSYSVNGGDAQAYDGPFTVSAKGANTITFWSADHAGNVEDREAASNTITVKIDGINPRITATRSPQPNADGWSNGPVTVTFTCSDAESGIAEDGCAAPETVSTAGADQSVTGTATDNAGNEASLIVDGIHIDLEAPATTATVAPAANEGGWNRGGVEVTLAATDDLSEVATTSYRLGDGEAATYDGPIPVDAEGTTTVTFFSVDKAGNVEDEQSQVVKIDSATPTISGSRLPLANDRGWNNGPVTVALACADEGSGVASCTPAETVLDSEGADQSVTGTATDHADNRETATVGNVDIDLTKPTISGSADRPANQHGWYNDGVVVSWTCDDELSGLAFCDTARTLDEEGAGQSAEGYASDKAGNVARREVAGVSIDKTKPSLTGEAASAPNSSGWYRGDVTVEWTASDALSGIDADTLHADETILGEGEGLVATASVADNAGNAITAQSAPVNIDRTAPTTTVAAPEGWTNTDVTLTLQGSDNLSGVAGTFFTVDGGEEHEGDQVELKGQGTHEVSFFSLDAAGNREDAKSVTVRIDKTAPSISHSLDPEPNIGGWNNSTVTVTFTCADEGGSGLASCTEPVAVDSEGRAQAVDGEAADHAGNTTPDQAFVNLDTTPPTISGAPDRAANDHGWYDDDVTVTWTADDALSGVASSSGAHTLGHGGDQSATGSATDAAGNEASATVSGLNIDTVAPTLRGTADADGWTNADVTVTWTCDDDLSGIDGDCPQDQTVSTEGANQSRTQTVQDLAGNATTRTVDGISVDKTAPITDHLLSTPAVQGWYADEATARLDAEDQAGLSGLKATYYRIGDGEAEAYDGEIVVSGGGEVTVSYWSVDHAGNVEAERSFTVNIDNGDPTISGSRTPNPNSHRWNNQPVEVSFDCADEQSGIASCPAKTTVNSEGAGQSVTGTAIDKVGKQATTVVGDINIDKTEPTVTGAPDRDANAAGWYNDDVTIRWTGQDGLSLIDTATQPADEVITGEGADLGADAEISDKAGNVGAGSVRGIRIDRTAPVVTGKADREPNSNGWYNAGVTVKFTGTDELSDVAETSDDVVVDGDGAGQTADGWARDKADNRRTTTVVGINIDSQAPSTTATVDCTRVGGYCTGASATVTLTASDQPGLSGIAEIRYRVNGGAERVVAGDEVEVPVDLTGSGGATVHYSAVDRAGNAETEQGQGLEYDNAAPVVTADQQPAPNGNGWNNSDVTVSFSATDEGSGVDESTITAPVTVSDETAGRVVEGEATDRAGNTGGTEVTVKLDKTAPTISGRADREPNGNGWYRSAVTVSFDCRDALSGKDDCTEPVTLTANAANQSAAGTATDKAGNTSTTTVNGINIDAVKPAVEIKGVASGAVYTLGAVPTASCEASDALSGLAGSCTTALTGGTANGVGSFTYTATATDKAGNTETKSATYSVVYGHSGFLAPVSDKGGPGTFKAGSTVPVKFRLTDANGEVVQAGALPQWLPPVKGSTTQAPVTESSAAEAPTSGQAFRWDPTEQQYIYNWKTDKAHADANWRIGVRLDDGRTYAVEIGVRK